MSPSNRGMFRFVGLVPDPCSALVPTLELVETLTSRSQVVMDPLEIFGFNPQPEPPGVVDPGRRR